MTPEQIPAVGLMMDLRERLVRIETKMDGYSEKQAALILRVEDNAERLEKLELAHSQLKTTVKVLSWIGGVIVTLATFFGERLVNPVP